MSTKDTGHGARRSRKRRGAHRAPLYAPPGTLSVDPLAQPPRMRVIAYGPDAVIDEPITNPEAVRAHLHRLPVTWLNVDGLGSVEVIQSIGELFGLHKLALEDVVHVHQRPKVDTFDDHLYIVAKMIDQAAERIETDQLSLFVGRDFVVTFQERPGDPLDAIRLRVKEKRGRIRDAGADYLAYAILDAVVDEYFPVLEANGDRLESLEEEVLVRPRSGTATRVHRIKRELLVLRRAAWPLRDALTNLGRTESALITPETHIHLRDCVDHTVQILDLVEVYRELCTGLLELYMTSISHRMNEIMKVLTIMSSIFIPLTFIAGVYGMNFDRSASRWNMPELGWPMGYPLVVALMALVAATMLVFFYRRGWLSGNNSRDAQDRASTQPHDGAAPSSSSESPTPRGGQRG